MELCANCGNALAGRYCHACGQKRFDLSGLALIPFLRAAARDLSHFDFKLFRDLPALVLRPGLLTAEYSQGKVSRHVKPITMFLWLNVFFFLGGYAFVLPQAKFQVGDHYWPGIQARVIELSSRTEVPREALIGDFNRHLTHSQRQLFFFFVPALALPMLLLYRGRPDNYFAKHAVYTLHFWCAFFLYFAAIGWLFRAAFFVVQRVSGAGTTVSYDRIALPLFLVVVLGYHGIALHRVFAQGHVRTLVKALLVTALTFAIFRWGLGLTYLLAYLSVR